MDDFEKKLMEMAERHQEKLGDLIMAYVGEKVKTKNIMNQAGANLMYIHGKNTANRLGLSDEEKRAITPFPPVVSMTVEKSDERLAGNETPDTKPGWNWKHGLGAGVLGASLLGGGYGLGQWLNPPETDPHPASEGKLDFKVES